MEITILTEPRKLKPEPVEEESKKQTIHATDSLSFFLSLHCGKCKVQSTLASLTSLSFLHCGYAPYKQLLNLNDLEQQTFISRSYCVVAANWF